MHEPGPSQQHGNPARHMPGVCCAFTITAIEIIDFGLLQRLIILGVIILRNSIKIIFDCHIDQLDVSYQRAPVWGLLQSLMHRPICEQYNSI